MFGRVATRILGRLPGDVDTMRFLGLDIELGPEEGTWLVHQQSYIYAFLQEMFDPECLKDRRTPGEPESFSDKPHDEPHAQKRTCQASTTSTRTGSPLIILQSCVLLVCCYGCPCEHVQIFRGQWLGLPDLLPLMKLVLVYVFDMLLSI